MIALVVVPAALVALQADRTVPALDAAGMHPEVARVFEEARAGVAAAPDDPEAWRELGALFDAHDLFAQAESCYLAAHELAPEDFASLYLLAVVSDLCGRPAEETLPRFEAAARLRPDYAPVHVHTGDALARQGRLAEARDAYGRAIAIDAAHFVAHRSLGQVLLALGELEPARQHLLHARGGGPDDRAVNAALAQVFLRLGDRDSAREAADATRGATLSLGYRDPVREDVVARALSTGARYERATAAREAGDVDGAVAELESILRLHPESPEAHARLGVIELERGNVPAAVGHLRTAVAGHPNDVDKRLVLGQALLRAGERDESAWRAALQQLRAARDLAPEDQAVAEFHGQALAHRGRDRAAVAEFERAAAGDRPLEELSYVLWGSVLGRLGEVEAALERFRDGVLFRPDSGLLRLNIGIALEQLGRADEALEAYDRAAAMGVPKAAERAAALRSSLGEE